MLRAILLWEYLEVTSKLKPQSFRKQRMISNLSSGKKNSCLPLGPNITKPGVQKISKILLRNWSISLTAYLHSLKSCRVLSNILAGSLQTVVQKYRLIVQNYVNRKRFRAKWPRFVFKEDAMLSDCAGTCSTAHFFFLPAGILARLRDTVILWHCRNRPTKIWFGNDRLVKYSPPSKPLSDLLLFLSFLQIFYPQARFLVRISIIDGLISWYG